jgi:two-component system, OmpR family, response regulator AdeR
LGAPHILVVDDEPAIRSLLRIFFERQGYLVTAAVNGLEALEFTRQVRPDCVLMDIQMPRMTGIDAVEELRADPRFEGLPVIAVTAHARDYTPSAVIRAGFDLVIYKPFDFAELQGGVDMLLARHAEKVHAPE